MNFERISFASHQSCALVILRCGAVVVNQNHLQLAPKETMHRRTQTPASRPLRKSFFVSATALVFAAATFSRFSSTSVNQGVKTAINDDVDALRHLDPEPKLLPLYDELGVYAHDLNTASNATSHNRVYNYYSPYKERFPNEALTFGFKKSIPYNDNVPTEKQICFVHGELNVHHDHYMLPL